MCQGSSRATYAASSPIFGARSSLVQTGCPSASVVLDAPPPFPFGLRPHSAGKRERVSRKGAFQKLRKGTDSWPPLSTPTSNRISNFNFSTIRLRLNLRQHPGLQICTSHCNDRITAVALRMKPCFRTSGRGHDLQDRGGSHLGRTCHQSGC
ncbi:hypothetical protein VN12_08870 [Pirellula sp. SH-Sr6A]|nr:hypothetical protein VN12_08870 [Pirellula sp. SH-Sr6A]